MSRFVILLGGALVLTPRLEKQVMGARAIAADSGMAHAELLGLDVELWVGDFDSTSEELARRHIAIERQEWPRALEYLGRSLAHRRPGPAPRAPSPIAALNGQPGLGPRMPMSTSSSSI